MATEEARREARKAYSRRNLEAFKCEKCPETRDEASARYCRKHREMHARVAKESARRRRAAARKG